MMAVSIISPGNAEFDDIMRRIGERIVELQTLLEAPLDQDQTNRTRGAIAELRRFVADAEQAKAPVIATTPRY